MSNSKESSKAPLRKSPRRYFTGAVGVLFKGRYEVTQGLSLGEGGLAFVWSQPLPLTEQVVVTFKIPGHDMVSIRGILRNVKPWEQNPSLKMIGLQFVPLSMGTKRRIRAFVSSRPENEPII